MSDMNDDIDVMDGDTTLTREEIELLTEEELQEMGVTREELLAQLDEGKDEPFQEEEEVEILTPTSPALEENPITMKEIQFVTLDPDQLIQQQQELVSEVSNVLGVPVGACGILLRSYDWNKEKLWNDFFENKERVIKKANINVNDFKIYQGVPGKEYECSVCFDTYDGSNMLAMACKHYFCQDCWRQHLITAINNGNACLTASCLERGCTNLIIEALVKELVPPDSYKIYSKYLVRSFVEDNPRIKWCPTPNCGRAVFCPETTVDAVQCGHCNQKFCFKCSCEAHVPASCAHLKAWKKKEQDESETATWLTANTKDCPKCNRSIEKNGGCNHMTCSQCKHEFCWVCMDDWTSHGSETGGYYKCNKYKPEDLKKKLHEDERESARAALEKYMHYFTRYANHDKSQKFERQLREKTEEKMRELTQMNKYSSWVDVEYIQKAVNTLIECRGNLKYTYVYGYYLEEGQEKNLFEYLQEDLERVTEKLSDILENTPVDRFNRDEIISTTRSAETRLKHLIEGVTGGSKLTATEMF
ncbi:hypothetical protein C9374_005816 [Naegleria lovaniensis]|uniref:RBR-type E3 ubiquitin transferase n=1 Tax=Naegleria lovaniensis TaxID=51637 RepID=A0AA88KHP7_NAELO|nr:uncharacterized protein C9374_005816 [Naegleria lovaniensis]KAG2382024.1 hypothetical protein C9374_005816 [Naegleria lovaniensis]